ncbi:E3 ubiquitin-protein ligase RNF5 [Babesia sp. Xinjiang]|uniref:E3 ubiquitin-protein ligase RNF5 n=1 Tax=Babesia sp. Xinjiang TaxID=462227 RepID=UPI000A2439A1|nr:E3 ubiquitin-protein ligase RNF5 [Babesia sp. Xinjiang]ORM40038.1 E3 ubiquitin-protein ligase RNF5 [Babesia sp. Xinjiang]
MTDTETQIGTGEEASPRDTGHNKKRQVYDCNICFEDVCEPVVTRCGHLFCWECLLTWMNKPNDHCPVCQAGITKENVIPLYGRGQENKDPRNKPTEPRPTAERPQPQQAQNNRNNTQFGGVVFSMFAFPFSVVMPFHFGGYGNNGFFNFMNMMTNTRQMTTEQRRAHVNSILLMVMGMLIIAYIVIVISKNKRQTKKSRNTTNNMATESRVSTLQKLFKSYSGGKSVMNSSNVDDLVRELGFAPSISELNTFKQKVGDTCGIEQLQELVDTLEHPEDTKENFLKFFKFYDTNNKGTVSRPMLEKLLTHVGEPLTQEELSAFFKKTCDLGDEVPYEKLINNLLMK